MKKAFFMVLGAVACGLLGYLLVALLTHVHEMYFAKGQDDMSQFAAVLVVVVFPLSLALGAWLGNFAYRRFLRGSH